MKTLTALLIGCSLAFAGAIMAQNPEAQESPAKKGGKGEKATTTQGATTTETAMPKGERGGGARGNKSMNATQPTTTSETGSAGTAETGAGRGKGRGHAKTESSMTGTESTMGASGQTGTGATTETGAGRGKGRGHAKTESSMTGTESATGASGQTGTGATTETGAGKGKGKHAKAMGETSAATGATGTSTSAGAGASASVAPTGGKRGGKGAGANARASIAPSASAAPSVAASASAAPSVAATGATGGTGAVTGATGGTGAVNATGTSATATGGGNANVAQGTVGKGGKKVETQQIQQIKQQHTSFKAQPRPDRAPAVTFNVNYRLPGAERWQGPQYEVFRSYHPERHDRGWYHQRYGRVELISGGYYFFNNGYWYPAWGYDPGHEYYAYDTPIYVGHQTRPPDQVIADVQDVLQQMGYYTGEVDGLLGPLTRQALRDYQADHGLMVTEVIDEPTLDALQLS